MFIQTLLPPVAGTTFRFIVAGCSGTTHIEVYANGKELLRDDFDGLLCKSSAVIPSDTEGSTLSISATDSTGNNHSLEYEISKADPGPHSMLSTTRGKVRSSMF